MCRIGDTRWSDMDRGSQILYTGGPQGIILELAEKIR